MTDHILIVEDSATEAQLLRMLLETHGYAVTVAGNGEGGLAAAREIKPSLIISDIAMPVMDGYQMCRAVKHDPSTADIPVMLLTSLADASDILRGLQAGTDYYLTKPYEDEHMLDRIESALAMEVELPGDDSTGALILETTGQSHAVPANLKQILTLLLSTYGDALQKNRRLFETQIQLKKLNDELEAANKELESFSYSVSHDLRAPLRAMDGFSRILMEDYSSELSEEGRRHLQRVRDSAKQMGQLVDDLLAFSRLSRTEMRKQPFAPDELARQVLTELTADGQNGHAQVSIGELPECYGDPALLKQVYANLLANALKFTSKRDGARIEFGFEKVNGEGAYFIKDNGVGFDMDYADKLFGVFQRLHGPEDFEGTGVGLAIVQRVIQRHGGRIWAEAEVDQGATFFFTLGGNSDHD